MRLQNLKEKIEEMSYRNILFLINKFVPISLLYLSLIFSCLFSIYLILYLPTQNGDTIEHIHSSFLISQGQVPYRDFFQHHNPLLWYIFAPLISLFAYNSTILEITMFISFLFFLKSLIYVYKISNEFLNNKTYAVITLIAIAIPGYKVNAIDFRPDNYMIFALLGGIYYYFNYLKNKISKDLIIAFIFFTLSFLLAQKAIFPLFSLGLTGLYFWYKKEILSKDLLKAIIAPVVILGCFIGYLCYYDMLSLYYISNFTFNLNLVASFENKIVNFTTYIKFWTSLALFCCLLAIKLRNRYLNIMILLFITELIQRKFYFTPFIYYYWLLVYFAAICGATALYHCRKINSLILWIIALFNIAYLHDNCIYYANILKNRKDLYVVDYITSNITPCDYVFNGDGMMYNLFGKNPSYYWQLLGQLDIIGEQTNISPKPNINELIIKYKPKFIYGKSYFDKFEDENGFKKVSHYIDIETMQKYYKSINMGVLYQLKPEYDNRECVKNIKTGKYNFIE